jgi:hypothetical protein
VVGLGIIIVEWGVVGGCVLGARLSVHRPLDKLQFAGQYCQYCLSILVDLD